MAFKNYFVDDEDVVPEPPMKTADDYSTPELEDIYSGLRSAGVSPEAGQRSVDMTRRLAGMVVPPPEGELPSDWAQIQAANKAPEAALIPTKSASPTRDALAPTTSAIAPVTADKPAGKPDSSGKMGMPVPSSQGAGGDADAENRLFQSQLLARMATGFGNVAAGRSTDIGVADMLGERLKQVQALRAKREEQGLTDARERANNRAQVDYLISRFPDRAEDLQKLYGMTGKPNFSQMLRVEEQVALDKAKKATEEVKPGIALRGVEVKEEDAESKARKREQDIALGWARLNAQSAAAAARAAQVVAESGVSRAEQKDVDGQLENIQKIVKAGGYTPMLAALQQADEAITSLGAPPSAAAQVKHALPGGDRFLSPQEKAYYTAVDKLKQMEQLAVSGKVVSESERAEFVRQYGTNWYANPKAAAAYIEMLRGKTANQLNMDLASVRASPAGQRALSAYEQAGGVTPMHPIFKGASATGVRPVKPADIAGTKTFWRPDKNTWVHYSADSEAKARAAGVRLEE